MISILFLCLQTKKKREERMDFRFYITKKRKETNAHSEKSFYKSLIDTYRKRLCNNGDCSSMMNEKRNCSVLFDDDDN